MEVLYQITWGQRVVTGKATHYSGAGSKMSTRSDGSEVFLGQSWTLGPGPQPKQSFLETHPKSSCRVLRCQGEGISSDRVHQGGSFPAFWVPWRLPDLGEPLEWEEATKITEIEQLIKSGEGPQGTEFHWEKIKSVDHPHAAELPAWESDMSHEQWAQTSSVQIPKTNGQCPYKNMLNLLNSLPKMQRNTLRCYFSINEVSPPK